MFSDHEFWIGAYDPEGDNIFEWINGGGLVDPHAMFWQADQPNNPHNQCLVMKIIDHHWNDQDCNDEFRFVCERDLQ